MPVTLENSDGNGDAPEPTMLDAARWLLARDAIVTRLLIDTMLADLPRLRELERQVTPGDETPLPTQWNEAELRARIRLSHVTLPAVRGRLPYFGVEFACDWEIEHGYGVMCHGTEIVEIGGGDVPNLDWVAARHAEGH